MRILKGIAAEARDCQGGDLVAPEGDGAERRALSLEYEPEVEHSQTGAAARFGEGSGEQPGLGEALPQPLVEYIARFIDFANPVVVAMIAEDRLRQFADGALLLAEFEIHSQALADR